MRKAILALLLLSLPVPALAAEPVDPLYVPPPPAAAEPVPEWLKYQDPYAGEQKNISGAHRTPEEIAAWVTNMAAEAMTFSPDTFNATLTDVKRKFNPQGWNEYAAWLKESQLVDMVRARNYGVSTISNGDASILNSGSVGGAYHWIVDVPVMIAFTQKGKDGGLETVPGGKYRLSMQVGRVEEGADEAGVVIESWKVVALGK